MIKKVIRNGKVAVLYSPGYGGGWYSWHNRKELVFHPEIVALVEQKRHSEITEELCQELLGIDDSEYICVVGASTLKIEWLPEGTPFDIEEYDGAENVKVFTQTELVA